MRKSTKGALAASAAALLLIGAWGTQASWSDDATVPGTDIETGHLSLAGECGKWQIKVLDANAEGGWKLVDFDPVAQLLAPGNLLNLDCHFTVEAVGVNLSAHLSVSETGLTGGDAEALDLAHALKITPTFTKGSSPISADTVLNDGDKIDAVVTVEVPQALTGAQGLESALKALTVTATQVTPTA
jgi:alternate signal-mediated exported protein